MTLLWASAGGLNTVAAEMEWNSTTNTPTIETSGLLTRSNSTGVRFAPGAIKQIQHASYSSGQGVHYYRIYIHLVTAPAATRTFFSINNAAATKIGIRLTNARVLQLFNEEDITQISSDSSAINTGEYYRLELKIDSTTLSSTSVEVRLYAASDEATLLWNPSGTANLAADPNRFTVTNANDGSLDFIVTDMTIGNDAGSVLNTWHGEGSLVYLRPSGAGASTQWSRGGADSGANWSQVEEAPPNDATDYVQSNTNNEIDDYAMTDTPSAVGSGDVINWVAPGVRFRISSTSGGDPDFVMRVTAGGNTDESANLAGSTATTAWRSYVHPGVTLTFPLVLTDLPGASTTAWTKSDLDSVQVGVRETATDTHFAQVTAVWLIFEHKISGGPAITDQDGFRFRNDDGSESGATALAAEDANASIDVGLNFRLRVQIDTTNNLGSTAFRLEYRKKQQVLLADAFDDDSFNTAVWEKSYHTAVTDPLVTVLETGGVLEITPRSSVSGSSANGAVSLRAYSFSDRHMIGQMTQVVNSAVGVFCNPLWVHVDDLNGFGFSYEAGAFYFAWFLNGVSTDFTSEAYNATNHAWQRLLHQSSDNKIYWYTSSDGVTWTEKRNKANPFDLSAVNLQPFSGGTYEPVGSPGSGKFKNFSFRTNEDSWTVVS